MCDLLTYFSPKEYITGFDNTTGAAIKTELNCFERLLRFIFGMYGETHLGKLKEGVSTISLDYLAFATPTGPDIESE